MDFVSPLLLRHLNSILFSLIMINKTIPGLAENLSHLKQRKTEQKLKAIHLKFKKKLTSNLIS